MHSLQFHCPTVQIPDSSSSSDADIAGDAYSSDEFRMYEFKVRRCPRGRSHDWTNCPFAHPGEKARRRDPRRFHYSAAPCPHSKKTSTPSSCPKGDACEFAHGVFECWLHPTRYRTQPCKDGAACGRRVCFFAHGPEELRVVTTPGSSPVRASPLLHVEESYDGSPMRRARRSLMSPTSILSPPVSPDGLVAMMRELRVRCGGEVSEEEEEETFDGLDVGWISELIK